MDQFAVWATMEAREGKEAEARAFLTEAARRLESEPGTTSFRAMQLGEREFAIFNSFEDEAALQGM
jgi:quinol monooxygenase YgiN